jgi:hypothetical protein
MGERLKSCDADYVKESLAEGLSEATQNAIRPLLKSVEEITKQIGAYDKKIQEIEKRYPETKGPEASPWSGHAHRVDLYPDTGRCGAFCHTAGM